MNDIKNTIRTNLRRIILDKNKAKAASEINKIYESKLKSNLNDYEFETIIRMMYKQDEYYNDVEKLLNKINIIIQSDNAVNDN